MLYILFAILMICFLLSVYREKICDTDKRKKQISIIIGILLCVDIIFVILF